MTDKAPVLAMSVTADFYPGLGDGNVNEYKGNSIEWTFALPRSAAFSSGIYEIRFVRSLKEEEDMGFPLLGGEHMRPDDERDA